MDFFRENTLKFLTFISFLYYTVYSIFPKIYQKGDQKL